MDRDEPMPDARHDEDSDAHEEYLPMEYQVPVLRKARAPDISQLEKLERYGLLKTDKTVGYRFESSWGHSRVDAQIRGLFRELFNILNKKLYQNLQQKLPEVKIRTNTGLIKMEMVLNTLTKVYMESKYNEKGFLMEISL